MTEAAEASDTSCSPERPPKMTPTRREYIAVILATGSRIPSRLRDHVESAAIPRISPSPRPAGAPGLQAAGELGFQAAVDRPVVAALAKRLGQVLLIHLRVGRIVRVLVARAVAQVAHEP